MNKKSFSFVCILLVALVSLCFFTSCDADDMKRFGELGSSISSNVVNSEGNTEAVEETKTSVSSSIDLYSSYDSLTPEQEEELKENAKKAITRITEAASTETGKASLIESFKEETDMVAEDYNKIIKEEFGAVIYKVVGNSIQTATTVVISDVLEIFNDVANGIETYLGEEALNSFYTLVSKIAGELGPDGYDQSNPDVDKICNAVGSGVVEFIGLTLPEETEEPKKATYGDIATLLIVKSVADSIATVDFSNITLPVITNLVTPILPALGAIDIASGTEFKDMLNTLMGLLPEILEG